ncbi:MULTISPECIES: DUF262 domain-containing protein [unclassified Roseitalea]|uniref:DUF262 domain-containing protein n=1 Tax=unclassified Roseitalea TaxID=2639107 RepID=UPI00273E25B0|nr:MULTISPECIES: DUF262 domain-containing protein [unclassified Roseitalea]
MEARNRTIEQWFGWIADGAVVLPRFQRYEAWGSGQVEGLLESVLRRPSLPVGALLMLEVGDAPPFHARPISGAPEGGKAAYHLLDGQQRMTGLWRSLSGDYDDFAFFVRTEPQDVPEVTATRRYLKGGKRYPVWCDDDAEVAARNLIPLPLLRPGQEAADAAKAWVKGVSNGEMDRAMALNEVITELRSRVSNYSLPFLSLPATTNRETALDVFIRMNTQGTALTAFDIVVAQVEADTGTSLHERVEGLRARVPKLTHYGEPAEIALAVGAVLSGRPPTRSTFLRPAFGGELVDVWDRIELGLERAVRFLADEAMVDAAILPSDPLVTLMGAFWADATEGKDAEGAARRLARQALWRGAFTERYQKTSATRTALDYRELVAQRDGDGPLPGLLDPEQNPLPEPAALRTGGWPKTRDRLGRAILAASLRVGGHDFADEQRFSIENQGAREYHHLFPKALLEAEGWPRRLVFCALNCALVSWRTNRTIGKKPPSIYVAERAEEVGLPTKEVDRRLLSHCIPPDALRSDEFETFLDVRAKMIHGVMSKLCNGEDVGLHDVV